MTTTLTINLTDLMKPDEWSRRKRTFVSLVPELTARTGMQCINCAMEASKYLGSGSYGSAYGFKALAVKFTARRDDRRMAAWDRLLRMLDLPSPFVRIYSWYHGFPVCDDHGDSDRKDLYVKRRCFSTRQKYTTGVVSHADDILKLRIGDAHNGNFGNFEGLYNGCNVSLLYDCFVEKTPADRLDILPGALKEYARMMWSAGFMSDGQYNRAVATLEGVEYVR